MSKYHFDKLNFINEVSFEFVSNYLTFNKENNENLEVINAAVRKAKYLAITKIHNDNILNCTVHYYVDLFAFFRETIMAEVNATNNEMLTARVKNVVIYVERNYMF